MRLTYFFILALLVFPLRAMAHPHVFVDYRVAVKGGRGMIASLHITYWFDAAYSAVALADLGLRPQPVFSAVDAEKISHMNDDDLPKHHFYTEGVPGAVQNIAARMDAGKLVLDFDMPLASPVKELTLSVHDPSFYIAFTQEKEDPVIVDADGVGCFVKWKGYATPFGVMITHPVQCGPASP